MEIWRYGVLEACCRCSDVEVWRSGDLEASCGRSDAEVWRMELWSYRGALLA